LANVPSITTGFSIGLIWTEPFSFGGVDYADYRVLYDKGIQGGDFVILDSNIVSLSYTVNGLTPGMIYTFTVAARNMYGYG